MPSSHLDISSEKRATGFRSTTATLRAMFTASADFPAPGRAAMMMKFESCRPDRSSSRSRKPVGSPAREESRCWMCSISSIAADTTGWSATISSSCSCRDAA